MFEPYTDPMSKSRRRLLNFHLHPIAVHFPTSFVVAILVFSVATFFFTGPVEDFLVCTTKVMALFLPLVVLLAFSVGLLDGRTRFRRLGRSHILKVKIIFGSIFFVLSIGLVLSVWLLGLGTAPTTWAAVLLATGGLACTVVLSLLGMQILNAAFPG